MEGFTGDKSFYDVGVSDLKELWDSDLETPMDVFGDADDGDWARAGLESRQVLLYDRLMTDAALGAAPIKSEHSYSLAAAGDGACGGGGGARSLPGSPLSLDRVMDEMERDCWPLASSPRRAMRSTRVEIVTAEEPSVTVKEEPLSAPPSPADSEPASPDSSEHEVDPDVDIDMDADVDVDVETEVESDSCTRVSINTDTVSDQRVGAAVSTGHGRQHHGAEGVRSVLKRPAILLAARAANTVVIPKLNIKAEPNTSGFALPPTPPSSTTSDSEGNTSPGHEPLPRGQRSASIQAHTRLVLTATTAVPGSRQPIQTPLISCQPKGSTGMLVLTEEEKRTLLAEGYPIPTRLPLTKAEEKSLKKIRRKIKNKISAQESRRKKKEYMDALERKVEILQNENSDYKKKIEVLEGNNASLLSQLQKLQSIVARGVIGNVTSSRAARNADNSAFLSLQHSSRISMK